MKKEEFINLKILGRGSKDEITKKVKSIYDQKIYVIKSLGEQQLSENQKDILNVLKKDECPYIVKHYPLTENNEIKTDFINDIDLQDYINTYMDLETPIEEKTLWKIFLQCIESIKYLHDKKIIHRNIRLENFYMTDEKDIKLGNFRYAAIMNGMDENINYPEEGMLYKSADTINNCTYNEKSDIYSLGVVFYNMCYFQFPFEIVFIADEKDEQNGKYELKAIKKKDVNYSNDLTNLINSMLEQNEKQRPNIKDIYNKVMKNYIEFSVENTVVEPVLRCLSSFGVFSHKQIPVIYYFDTKKDEIPLFYNIFKVCNYFITIEKEGIKEKEKYIEYITNLRILLEKYLMVKQGIKLQPNKIVEFILNKFWKESYDLLFEKGNEVDKQNFNKFKYYFNGEIKILPELESSKKYNYQYNLLTINFDDCKKNSTTNVCDITSQIIHNDSLQKLKVNYEITETPRYLVIAIDRGKMDNVSHINFPNPLKIGNDNNIYTITGYLFRTNEEGDFICVYKKKINRGTKDEVTQWKLSKGNSIKTFQTEESALNDLNESVKVEMLFYRKK